MSDKNYEYIAVPVPDDDDEELLTHNSEDNMCCICWIFSKLKLFKRYLSQKINQWFCKRRIPENSEALYKCTVTLPKCLLCWTIGWYFSQACWLFCGKLKSCFRFIVLHAQGCCYIRQAEKRYQQEAERLKEECRNLEIRLSDCQTEVQKLEIKLSKTEESLNDERQEKKILLYRFEEERREKEKALKRFEEERQEKEKALTRLSSIAGEKLRVNNPGIADLSDENRPNKLGEKFSELYDNEWTEVFESLDEAGLDEEKIIKQLLDILKDVYSCCQRYAKAQRERLIQIITLPSRSEEQLQDAAMPEKVMSKVVDLQKQTASIALSDLKTTVIDTRSHLVDTKVKQTYTYRCMQLCWMMAIQDPPMALDFGPAQDEDFDRNVFRLYTQQGNKVAFIVWPAIYLHDKGPLVQKGVLQPVPS